MRNRSDDFLILSVWFENRGDTLLTPAFHRGGASLDTVTDFDNFLILAAHLGESRPAAAQPEPSSHLLMAIGLLCFATLRRKRR